jgi:hypothetical protein
VGRQCHSATSGNLASLVSYLATTTDLGVGDKLNQGGVDLTQTSAALESEVEIELGQVRVDGRVLLWH